jgi:ABC-2 type transport system permease protein
MKRLKGLTIVRKEYRLIVKKKSFIISTILTPLLMAAFIFLPVLMTKYGRGKKDIDVADLSGLVVKELMAKSKEVKDTLQFQEIGAAGQDERELIEIYRQKILEKEVDGFLLIPKDIKQARKVQFFALNISDFETNKYISVTLQEIISRQILNEQQIDPGIVREATRSVVLDTFKVKKEGVTRSSSGLEYMMSIFMLTILFSIIMAYGQLIMRGVLEEKNSRIVEILISSTNTRSLFYGKIIGIGLAGLTQVGLWIVIGGLFLSQATIEISAGIKSFLSLELALYFVLFFILGYFMYSILFSIVGAAVNTDQEAQQFAAPISYLLIIPFILGIMVTQNPNSLPVVIASLFPLFSPTLMFMRISVAVPSMFQIILSVALTLFTIWFMAWLGAKIFRTGLLMYGKKPSIKEIIRWLKYK